MLAAPPRGQVVVVRGQAVVQPHPKTAAGHRQSGTPTRRRGLEQRHDVRHGEGLDWFRGRAFRQAGAVHDVLGHQPKAVRVLQRSAEEGVRVMAAVRWWPWATS